MLLWPGLGAARGWARRPCRSGHAGELGPSLKRARVPAAYTDRRYVVVAEVDRCWSCYGRSGSVGPGGLFEPPHLPLASPGWWCEFSARLFKPLCCRCSPRASPRVWLRR